MYQKTIFLHNTVVYCLFQQILVSSLLVFHGKSVFFSVTGLKIHFTFPWCSFIKVAKECPGIIF